MVFKKNKSEKFLSPEALEERLRKSDLSEEEKKLSREVIKQAKQHNIGLAEAEIDVGKRNFLKGMGILAGAILVLGKVPKVFADTMIEKFNLDLGSEVLKQRPSELYYWSQIWKSNYINEFGVQIGLEFRKEEITKDSSDSAITQAVRNAATTMENLLNAFTCWGQNTPWQTTRGVCGDAGFCQTFAQLHAPAGQYFCSPNTRMVGWDIRVLNAKFLPNGDLKLRMNVLIVDKQYFDTSERVDAPWIHEKKFAPPMYIKILNLKKVLGSGKPWPSPNYYTFQSGPNKGKEYKDGSPFEASDFLGERVPPYTKLDQGSWVKDLTLKVLRGGGTDSGELTLDPMTPYPFQHLGDRRGLKLLKKINAMQNEGWRKYQPTKGDYHVFIDEYRATYAELWKHIHALGNAYYKYIEPSFYHLVWFTYGTKNYGGEVILNVNIKSGCQPSDSPIPGANCETGCLLAGALTASYPCLDHVSKAGNTCPASGFNVTANVDCTTPIKVTLSILNCYQNNTPVKDTTIYYKYGYGANWNYGSFNTGTTGTGDIIILEKYTKNNKGEFWLSLYTDSDQTGEFFNTLYSVCACDSACCSNEDCPPGYVCVNNECVPSVGKSSGNTSPTISNPEWDTNDFCTKGFTVKGTFNPGSGSQGIINIAVNGHKVSCLAINPGDDYTFSIFIPLKKYQQYIGLNTTNTITATAVLCGTSSSNNCSSGCNGAQTQYSHIPDCNCKYSLDCTKFKLTWANENDIPGNELLPEGPAGGVVVLETNKVSVDDAVTVSGAIIVSGTGSCPLNGKTINIYDNNVFVGPIETDTKGNFSTIVIMKTVGTHNIEARFENGICESQIEVVQGVVIRVEYYIKRKGLVQTGNQFGIFLQYGNVLEISPGTPLSLEYANGFDLDVGTIKPLNVLHYLYPIAGYKPEFEVSSCTTENMICNDAEWALHPKLRNTILSKLEKLTNPDNTPVFSKTQSIEITTQIRYAAVDVFKRWFQDNIISEIAGGCPSSDGVGCGNNAVEITISGEITFLNLLHLNVTTGHYYGETRFFSPP